MFPVPDLDAMTADQLDDLSTVLGMLAAIAGYKSMCKNAELKGQERLADSSRRWAKHTYEKLPAWAKYAG